MQDNKDKNIGKVVDSDFNKTPGALNDTSDVDVSELQYTSPILEKMKADGVYDNLCGLIRSIKMADKSDAFIIRQIKKRFNTYCGGLTQPTFKRWLGGEYKEISEAYHFGKDIALGELLSIGMNVVRKNKDSLDGGEFALKLMDRLDNGLINHRNKPEVIDKSAGASSETAKTLSKLVSELASVESHLMKMVVRTMTIRKSHSQRQLYTIKTFGQIIWVKWLYIVAVLVVVRHTV